MPFSDSDENSSDEQRSTVRRGNKAPESDTGDEANGQPKKTKNFKGKKATKLGPKNNLDRVLPDSDDESALPPTMGFALHNVSIGEEDAHQGPTSPPTNQFEKLSVNGSNPTQYKAIQTLYMQEKLANAKKKNGHPAMTVILKNAIEAKDDGKGASIIAIKKYIESTYPDMNMSRINDTLRKALRQGIDEGILKRPRKTSENQTYNLTGRVLIASSTKSKTTTTKRTALPATVTKPPEEDSTESDSEEQHTSSVAKPKNQPKKIGNKTSGKLAESSKNLAASAPLAQKNPAKASTRARSVKPKKDQTKKESNELSEQDNTSSDDENKLLKKPSTKISKVVKPKKSSKKTETDSDGVASRSTKDSATSTRSRKDLAASSRSRNNSAASRTLKNSRSQND